MKVLNQIKNYIQLHTSDMENSTYISLMRTLGEWANNQADLIQYSEESEDVLTD